MYHIILCLFGVYFLSTHQVSGADFRANPSTVNLGGQNPTTSLNITCTPNYPGMTAVFIIEIGKTSQSGTKSPIIQIDNDNTNSVTIRDVSFGERISTSGYINGSTGSLMMSLRDLRCTDAASYYCKASINTASGSATDEEVVNVTARASPETIAMTITPNRVVYDAGEEIQFSCSGHVGNREGTVEGQWNWQWRNPNWVDYPYLKNITYQPKQPSGNCQYTAKSTLTHVVTANDNGRQFRCYVINEMYGDNRAVYVDNEVSTSTLPTTSTVDTGHGLSFGTGMTIRVSLMLVVLLL